MSGPVQDIEVQADLEQPEPRDSESGPRSKFVTDTTNFKSGGDGESPRPSHLLPLEVIDTLGQNQQELPPLGVKLTGYRLLKITVILAFGISKAVFAYRGQSVVPTMPEWVAGTFLAVILYWLGLFETERPGKWPLFFHDDWGPPILRLGGMALYSEAFHDIIRALASVEVLYFMQHGIQPPTTRESSWMIVAFFWLAAGVVAQLLVFVQAFVLWFLVDVCEAPRKPLLARFQRAARQAWR
ncbi:hypothetical protein BJV78DRAFT_1286418 [Lactifluus subvellereus]|nr:hypothetical protein BJV78DRAFT_1286418 [Lactifluus subvellereus]